eukprot:TRINITY_DN23684_c0_g1_i1.p1 TRINITY_DN23684_c0_g1~~TRINITY_DN23684_c0_g1_i1.p1  ORF type:complete len:447 (-),score=61.98 TRINITY_DN23684_c0_g1_i1:27-1367(-)
MECCSSCLPFISNLLRPGKQHATLADRIEVERTPEKAAFETACSASLPTCCSEATTPDTPGDAPVKHHESATPAPASTKALYQGSTWTPEKSLSHKNVLVQAEFRQPESDLPALSSPSPGLTKPVTGVTHAAEQQKLAPLPPGFSQSRVFLRAVLPHMHNLGGHTVEFAAASANPLQMASPVQHNGSQHLNTATAGIAGPDAPKSPDAVKLMAEVKKRMPELSAAEESWMSQPQVLDIYLKARSTLSEQASIMQTALEWRVENRTLLSTLACPCCAENALSHDARCFGTDLEGDIIFMNCFALPRNMDPTGIAQHMTCLFERALKRYPNAKKWTWIIDMHGFGIANMDPRTSIKLLNLLQVSYRGRLKRCIVLDAPFGFGTLWSSIKVLINKQTASSIQFRSYPEISADLEKLFGCSIASQLQSEMEENRDDSRAREKTWTTFWAA